MSGKDFLFTLKLKQDKNSFEQGAKSVDNVANNISRLIGTARNAAAAMVALGVASGKVGAADVTLSTQLNLGVKRLETWKVAANKAGMSATELTQSMAGLDRKFLEWEKRGKADDALAKASSQLGLNLEETFSLDADKRVEKILQAAQSLAAKEGDARNAASLVSQILGGAGEKMFLYLQSSQKSIGSLISDAEKITFFDDEAARKAFGFNNELNETITIMKQLGTFAGAEFGGGMTTFLKEVNDFFKDNGDDIKEKIEGFSKALGKIGTALKPFAEGALKTAVNGIYNLFDAVSLLLSGDLDTAQDKFGQFFKETGKAIKEGLLGNDEEKGFFDKVIDTVDKSKPKSDAGNAVKTAAMGTLNAAKITAAIITGDQKTIDLNLERGRINAALKKDNPGADALFFKSKKKTMDELPDELRVAVSAYIGSGGNKNDFAKFIDFGKIQDGIIKPARINGKIQDGIMRPDGRVTQVAPDDWVFAARSIGDLARMFLPPSVTNNSFGAPSMTINQTLNIQGGAPFPQAVRAAAYSGTQDALRSITASSQRMQMMPGLR